MTKEPIARIVTDLTFSPPVQAAADKVSDAIGAIVDCLADDVPTCEELFDVILCGAAAVFAAGPNLSRGQRKAIVRRFEDALKHQIEMQTSINPDAVHPGTGGLSS